MKKILILLVCLILVGCKSDKEKTKLDIIIEENNYTIIDVRTKAEYLESHLVGSINIPYDEIDSSITIDKNKTILVYCKSGKRSAIANEKLSEMGYEVYDLGAYEGIDLPKE